jgi:hypothetical protein
MGRGSERSGSGGSAPSLFDRTLVGTSGPQYNYNQWRDPEIFEKIAAAGQSVLSINVITVPAFVGTTSSGWVPTGLSVQPGQNVWLDTRADGMWTNGNLAGAQTTDANGIPGSTNGPGNIDADLPDNMLIGYVGNPPQLPYDHQNMAISGDPRFIPSGDTLLNFPVGYTGPISLADNENQGGDSGFQTVRVIITR